MLRVAGARGLPLRSTTTSRFPSPSADSCLRSAACGVAGLTVGIDARGRFASEIGAPRLNPEPQRPAGYEETGWVTRDIPGVGVSVYSSTGTYHTKQMETDALGEVGHTAFLMDAKIMASVLHDYLTSEDLRAAVTEEHAVLGGLLGNYHERLREVYAPELESEAGS